MREGSPFYHGHSPWSVVRGAGEIVSNWARLFRSIALALRVRHQAAAGVLDDLLVKALLL